MSFGEGFYYREASIDTRLSGAIIIQYYLYKMEFICPVAQGFRSLLFLSFLTFFPHKFCFLLVLLPWASGDYTLVQLVYTEHRYIKNAPIIKRCEAPRNIKAYQVM